LNAPVNLQPAGPATSSNLASSNPTSSMHNITNIVSNNNFKNSIDPNAKLHGKELPIIQQIKLNEINDQLVKSARSGGANTDRDFNIEE
jgi:polyisoprenoid-binding protein YceI